MFKVYTSHRQYLNVYTLRGTVSCTFSSPGGAA